jgi:hypothetical protein
MAAGILASLSLSLLGILSIHVLVPGQEEHATRMRIGRQDLIGCVPTLELETLRLDSDS